MAGGSLRRNISFAPALSSFDMSDDHGRRTATFRSNNSRWAVSRYQEWGLARWATSSAVEQADSFGGFGNVKSGGASRYSRPRSLPLERSSWALMSSGID